MIAREYRIRHSHAVAGNLASSALLAAAALIVTPAPSWAAEPVAGGDELSEVVVTGSRIRGVEAVGSPVIALSREDIVAAGAPTTGDLIRKLPQIVGLGASETASSAQNGAANVTRGLSVNLRGIGSNATLLLFDGRRLPPAGTQGQYTDASVTPSLAVERLEVVADGGSAIYGSDAVTGVVNLIPRTQFKGAETAVRFGGASGYHDWSIGQIVGADYSRGHVMAALDYEAHSALQGQDRDFYTMNLTARGGSDFRANTCSPGNIIVGGVSYAIPVTSLGVGLTASQFTANTRNLCDNLKRGDIIPDLKRVSALASATFDINERLTLFTEDYYSKRESRIQVDSITSTLTVTNANPFYFNPTGGTGPVSVQYDFANDGGLPRNPISAKSWQLVGGLRAKLGGDWRGEVSVSQGKSADNTTRVQNLNTTASGINAALALTSAATAFNPFGRGGVSNAATVASIRNGQFIIDGDSSLTSVVAQADGSIFQMSGGAARLAAGAEYRREGLGGMLQSGSTTAPTIVPNEEGKRNVKAVYAEAYLPFFGTRNARAGAQRLDLSIAGRYEKYSDFGNTFNPKVGLVWAPLEALKVQGSWGKSFRAPGLAETTNSSGYGLYGDTLPCTNRPPATTCFGIGIAGGNPDLQPEKATTWSTGLEFAPESWGHFKATATYFHIDYTNQIVGLRGTTGLLTNPLYAQFANLNPTTAQINALLASGLPINSPITASAVTYIQDGRRQNVGGTFARGYDFDVSDSFDTGLGKLHVGASGSYFTSLTTAITADAPQVDVLGTIGFPQRFRGRGELGLSKGLFSGSLFFNYVGAYLQTPTFRVSPYQTVDLHLGFDIGASHSGGLLSGVSLAVDVQNIANTDPPFVNLSGGYDPQSASPLGRLAAVSLRKSW